MSSSSDNELPLSAAESRTLEKQPTHPPPPPPPTPAPKRRRGKGKAKRDDGVAPQHFKLTDAERDLFMDYLRERLFMYEKKDKDYKDAPRRKGEWEACANLVGRTVELLQGWLKSLRSMLGKARSIKSKSGSGSEPLPPSLQWVYDNLSFMSAGQEFCIQKPWAQGGVFLAPHSRMRLTLRSLARAKAPGMQLHLRLHQGHTAAPLLSASHAYMNGPPAKAPSARLLRRAAAISAPSWMRCTSICETLKSSS